MLTEDKVRAGVNYDLDDNINTRDMNRTLRNTALLFAGMLTLLVAAGSMHIGNAGPQAEAEAQKYPLVGAPTGSAAVQVDSKYVRGETAFDVRHAVGFLERPGTVGQPQQYTPEGLGMVKNLPDAAAQALETHSTVQSSSRQPHQM